jgi:anti-anti-sigma regulatory factor
MAVEHLSDEVLLVVLPKEPQLRHELETINETISNNGDYDVVIDFSRVEILTSSSISNLLILQNLLCERGRRLILSNVALPTRGLFNVVGLEGFFSFADDKYAALANLQHAKSR